MAREERGQGADRPLAKIALAWYPSKVETGEVGSIRILATFGFSFSFAIFMDIYLGLGTAALWLSGVLICLLWLPLVVFRKNAHWKKRSILVLLGLTAGFLWSWLYTQIYFQPAAELDNRTERLTATVADWPQEGRYGVYTVLARVETDGFARPMAVLHVDGQGADLKPGDQLTAVIHCTLGNRTTKGEEITYYTAKGIFLQGQAYGRLDITRPEKIPLSYWPSVLAKELKEGIHLAFPQEEAGVIEGIVTGNREHLTDQFTSSLQRVGLSHTVAVSGMHLAFLAELLSALLGKGKRPTAVLTILWAILFSGLAGNTPSVNRAAIMIILLQLAPLFSRERDSATSLSFALMFLLLLNPFSAAHIGLQLSFTSVAGILLFSDLIQNWLVLQCHLDRPPSGIIHKVLGKIMYLAIASISATLGASILTTPLVAYYFKSFSVISPLANLMILWAVGFIFMGGLLIGGLAVFFSGLANLLAIPITYLVRYVLWAVDLLSKPALAALSMESLLYRGWLFFLYGLIVFTILTKGKKRVCIPLCAGVFTLTLAVLVTGIQFRLGGMTVAILDVGQGQSVLIREGDLCALVDCGGDSLDNPGDIAADYIQTQGQSSLDLLVVSHYHDDHANGIPQLLNRIDVGAIALPDVEPEAPLRKEIISTAHKKGTEVILVTQDTELKLGENQFFYLYAPMNQGHKTNELGLTVLAKSGEFETLMTGDMGAEGEGMLLQVAQLPQIDLLVVGHHGSDTSTSQELLDRVRPKLAAISTGPHNRYGHPAQATLDRLEDAGVQVYRTDLDGRIEIKG